MGMDANRAALHHQQKDGMRGYSIGNVAICQQDHILTIKTKTTCRHIHMVTLQIANRAAF
jgi:hypothetical protein